MKAYLPICLLAAALGAVCLSAPKQESKQPAGYVDAAAYADGFLAVGSQGRLEKIAPDGSSKTLTTTLLCTFEDVAVTQNCAVAVGGNGEVARIAPNGGVTDYKTGADAARSVCYFGGTWLVGAEKGVVQTTTNFQSWQTQQLPVKGAITGLAADDARCIGVTDLGEVLVTTDSAQWTVLDYNQYYNKTLHLQGIEVFDGTFWAFGTQTDGTNRIITSQEGGVWSERTPDVMEAGQMIDLSATPIAGLCYDGEQVIAALSDGRALTLPSCAECNKLTEVSDVPLGAAAYREGTLLFAGENFSFTLENALGLRQDGIRATAAREMQTGGAQIIDVRGKADFDQKHIAGSIGIPVEEIAAKLPALCPDRSQRLIFYCVSGVRSQKALETARALGYASVYNLGGIEDWSFAFELAGS